MSAMDRLHRFLTTRDPRHLHGLEPAEAERVLWLLSAVCGRLLARRFATPDDARIHPFLEELDRRVRLPRDLAPPVLERVIRATLGDSDARARLPRERVSELQLVLVLALLDREVEAPSDLEDLLSSAAELAWPATGPGEEPASVRHTPFDRQEERWT